MNKLLNLIFNKEISNSPPIWIMRQAGRYLPEYRDIRFCEKNFLDLCYNSKLASEITLQPIKRFDLDAAIIFSDILVIPDALGVSVEFVKNEGPKLKTISNINELNELKYIKERLNPISLTINNVKQQLSKDKALIGFSGSPFTIACYMIEGGPSKNFEKTRKILLKDEEFFEKLIDVLIFTIIDYLSEQIIAGVDLVKLFESFAFVLPEKDFAKFIISPTKKIIDEIRKKFPSVPVIAFPRGCGVLYKDFFDEIKPDVIAIDQNLSKKWARENLQKNGAIIQGNLDNYLLSYGSKAEIEKEVKEILNIFGDFPFIFNLGHGILKDTPIENVEFLMSVLRKH
jgi:uroporphyrinogen decarboxylase